MKKPSKFWRGVDNSQRAQRKLELFGGALMAVGILIAFIGNSLGGNFGHYFLIAGIACIVLGGTIAVPGIFLSL